MSQIALKNNVWHGPTVAARRDALIVVVIAITAAIVCVKLNVSEALAGWFKLYEQQQLDELPPVLLVLTTSLVWYSARRYREVSRQVLLRRATENQLAAALAENQRLAQQYVELQEYERKALARDLHDELGQYLNVMKLDAVSIRDAGHGEEALVGTASRALIDNVDRIYAVVSNLIRHLRPVGFDELGIAAAVEYCVNDWRARLPGVTIDLSVVGELRELGEIKRLALFRLVQESLTNIARHAQASRVTIRIERAGRREPGGLGIGEVVVAIADNGKGMDLEAPRAGLGLVGMRERVAALGGLLKLTSRPGAGLEIVASIPLAAPLSAERQP
jgi:two-component system, NarL family, sensor histidine kinase UhpB